MNTTISDTDHTMSPVRALHSLREPQVAEIVAGLGVISSEWSIERHESCDGHLILLLLHRSHDLAITVDRDRSGMIVSVMTGDDLESVSGRCNGTDDALTALRAVLGRIDVSHQRCSA